MDNRTALLQLISCIDLTSLESIDHEQSIMQLVHKANEGFEGTYPAAVCVYPNFGSLVAKNLTKSIQTAVVGGCFPSGQTLTEAKVSELMLIENSTVQEVDIVINRGAFISGDHAFVSAELKAMRLAIPTKKLKVILETGELKSAGHIQKAAAIAIDAGADFIKTSTGKSTTGATPEAVEIMCHVVQDHFKKTGKKIGIKPSGGIRQIEDALRYVEIVRSNLGDSWIHPSLFRIGASSLYDAILTKLNHGNHN